MVNNVMSKSDGPIDSRRPRKPEFLRELIAYIDDPNHKRVLSAYKLDDPVQSMEAELSRILMEIVKP